MTTTMNPAISPNPLIEAQEYWVKIDAQHVDLDTLRSQAKTCIESMCKQHPAQTASLFYTIKSKLKEIKDLHPDQKDDVREIKGLFGSHFQTLEIELAALAAAERGKISLNDFLAHKSCAKKLFSQEKSREAILRCLEDLGIKNLTDLSCLLKALKTGHNFRQIVLSKIQSLLADATWPLTLSQQEQVQREIDNILERLSYGSFPLSLPGDIFKPLFDSLWHYFKKQNDADVRRLFLKEQLQPFGTIGELYRGLENFKLSSLLMLDKQLLDKHIGKILEAQNLPSSLVALGGLSRIGQIICDVAPLLQKDGDLPYSAFSTELSRLLSERASLLSELHRSPLFPLAGTDPETSRHLHKMLSQGPVGSYILTRDSTVSYFKLVILIRHEDGIKRYTSDIFTEGTVFDLRRSAGKLILPHEDSSVREICKITQPLSQDLVHSYIANELPSTMHTVRHDKEIDGAFKVDSLLEPIMGKIFFWNTQQQHLALPIIKEAAGLDSPENVERFFSQYDTVQSMEHTSNGFACPELTSYILWKILEKQKENILQKVSQVDGWADIPLSDPKKLAEECQHVTIAVYNPHGAYGKIPLQYFHRLALTKPSGSFIITKTDQENTLYIYVLKDNSVSSFPLYLTTGGFFINGRCYPSFHAIQEALELRHFLEDLCTHLDKPICERFIKEMPFLKSCGDFFLDHALGDFFYFRGFNSDILRSMVNVARHYINNHLHITAAEESWRSIGEALKQFIVVLNGKNYSPTMLKALKPLEEAIEKASAKAYPIPYTSFRLIHDFTALKELIGREDKDSIRLFFTTVVDTFDRNTKGLLRIKELQKLDSKAFIENIAKETWSNDQEPLLHYVLLELSTYLEYEQAKLLLSDSQNQMLSQRLAGEENESEQERLLRMVPLMQQYPLLATIQAKIDELKELRIKNTASKELLQAIAADDTPDDPAIAIARRIGAWGFTQNDLKEVFKFAHGKGFETFAAEFSLAELENVNSREEFLVLWEKRNNSPLSNI